MVIIGISGNEQILLKKIYSNFNIFFTRNEMRKQERNRMRKNSLSEVVTITPTAR
jgi:hypothetical protein